MVPNRQLALVPPSKLHLKVGVVKSNVTPKFVEETEVYYREVAKAIVGHMMP